VKLPLKLAAPSKMVAASHPSNPNANPLEKHSGRGYCGEKEEMGWETHRTEGSKSL